MKKGLRPARRWPLEPRTCLNRDLMKKGLRLSDEDAFLISCPFESRPYEEGIKTGEFHRLISVGSV